MPSDILFSNVNQWLGIFLSLLSLFGQPIASLIYFLEIERWVVVWLSLTSFGQGLFCLFEKETAKG